MGSLLLILCGSYLGFMEKAVLGRESPLFGRRTAQLFLRPFDHREAAQFHPGIRRPTWRGPYGICGGIPLYLDAWDGGASVEQNLARLFLDETALLSREPHFLLREELRDLALYHSVLTAMAGGASAPVEIAGRAELDPHTIAYPLGVLCDLGYTAKTYPVSGRRPFARAVRYRLEDPGAEVLVSLRLSKPEPHPRDRGPRRRLRNWPARTWTPGSAAVERVCRESLPLLYAREGVSAGFEAGQYWDPRAGQRRCGDSAGRMDRPGRVQMGRGDGGQGRGRTGGEGRAVSKPVERDDRGVECS